MMLVIVSQSSTALSKEMGPDCHWSTTNCHDTCKGDYGITCPWTMTCDAVSHSCSKADLTTAKGPSGGVSSMKNGDKTPPKKASPSKQ